MPIYYNDFQSYTVGQTSPWGSLTNLGLTASAAISNTALPDGSQGPYGKAKYLSFGDLALIQFNDGIARNSGTFGVAIQAQPVQAAGSLGEIVNFNTFVMGFGFIRLCGLQLNADGTLSFIDRNGLCLGPLSSWSLKGSDWVYLQVNVNFFDSGGHRWVDYDVWVDGDHVLSGSGDTTLGAGNQWSETEHRPTISYGFGEYFLDVLTAGPSFPNPGTPVNRSTNQVIELIIYEVPAPALTLGCPTGTGTIAVPYSSTPAASGGVPPYGPYALVSGPLPPGLSLNTSTGLISGTPTTAGTYPIELSVTDSVGTVADSSGCQIVISAASGLTIACPVGGATVGTFYSQSPIVSGGTPPYGPYAIISGALPPGLSLNSSSGVISGTPSTAGTPTYTIEVTDSAMATATATCHVPVAGLPCPSVVLPGSG